MDEIGIYTAIAELFLPPIYAIYKKTKTIINLRTQAINTLDRIALGENPEDISALLEIKKHKSMYRSIGGNGAILEANEYGKLKRVIKNKD
jgi:hypothetical protein